MSATTTLTELPVAKTAAPHPSLQRLYFTPEMFRRLGELGFFDDERKYELIEGDIYPMTPEGPEHASIGSEIAYQFIRRDTAAWHARVEKPLRLGENELVPDLAIVPGRPRDYLAQHPTTALLMVEIAYASLPKDQTLKLRLYAQGGIPEYWIVNLQDRRSEVYREPAGDAYKAVRYYTLDEVITPLFAPDWAIPVSDLFGGAQE
ncbi:MAG: Uma2 family endonuclease [Fimbriimonadales bacterium]|nr:Uma2 family endonuclease [Fimbriimonadales bacterium]